MGIVNGLYNLGGTVEYDIPMRFNLDNILIKRKADYYSLKQTFDGKTILNTFRAEAAGRPIYFTYELDTVGYGNLPYLDNQGRIVKINNPCPIHSSSNDNAFATLLIPITNSENFDRYIPYFLTRNTINTISRTGTYENSYHMDFTVLRHVVGASECDFYGKVYSTGSMLYFSGSSTSGPDDPNLNKNEISDGGNGTIGHAYTESYVSNRNYYVFYRPYDIDELWIAIVFSRQDRSVPQGGQLWAYFDSTTSVTLESTRIKLTRYTSNVHFVD